MAKKKKYTREDQMVFEILINDDDNTGVRLISLVEDPAIEVMGMYFSQEQLKNFEFKAIKEQKKIVGPAMVPDKRIFRSDDLGEYYLVFTKDVIRQIVAKMKKANNNRIINVDHSNKMVNARIEHDWIIEDATFDKSRMYGFNLPIGTYFIELQIEDDKFWEQEVKDMNKFGFSVEGTFLQREFQFSMNNVIDSLSDDEVMDILNYTRDLKFARDCNVHPNCFCQIIDGEWKFNSTGYGLTDSDSPCDHCQDAKKQWEKTGKINKL